MLLKYQKNIIENHYENPSDYYNLVTAPRGVIIVHIQAAYSNTDLGGKKNLIFSRFDPPLYHATQSHRGYLPGCFCV